MSNLPMVMISNSCFTHEAPRIAWTLCLGHKSKDAHCCGIYLLHLTVPLFFIFTDSCLVSLGTTYFQCVYLWLSAHISTWVCKMNIRLKLDQLVMRLWFKKQNCFFFRSQISRCNRQTCEMKKKKSLSMTTNETKTPSKHMKQCIVFFYKWKSSLGDLKSTWLKRTN